MTYHTPLSGPSCGGTAIRVNGFGFRPFEDRIDSKTKLPANMLYVRYLDSETEQVISPSKLVDPKDYHNNRINLISEPNPVGTKALI